ncbi:MFS transporter [Pseudomonas sp. BGr12]|uniref:MFS transporter n=1 Tax=Pseudomonas sp. BGr12 TaxID=2936269 RepID=UPI0025594CB0|nr:MFS transporter [Pseudomonas sp. BJa5]MDL2428457.1 MFS transporter [Pseudomonas sp. BJa5]
MNTDECAGFEATRIQQVSALLIPCFAYVAVLGIPMEFSGIIDTYNVGTSTATIATTIHVSCIGLASLFVSLALSRLNPRTTFILGIFLAVLGQIAMLVSPDLYAAVAARGISGVGEGLCIGIGFASLAQMAGGTKLLGYSPGISAAITLSAFIAVPSANALIGPRAIFWMLLVGYLALLPLAFKLPSHRLKKLAADISEGAFNLRSFCLFALCLLSSMGANTLWLYFEQAGQNAHLNYSQIGMLGSVSMLACIFVPPFANYVFDKTQGITPLLTVCLIMAVTSRLFVVPNNIIFTIIVVAMSCLYLFVLAYARMYSASFDNSGRTTAAVSGADSLGMVVGPIIVALSLNLDSEFSPLGDFGALMQILCIVPAALLLLKRRVKGTQASS